MDEARGIIGLFPIYPVDLTRLLPTMGLAETEEGLLLRSLRYEPVRKQAAATFMAAKLGLRVMAEDMGKAFYGTNTRPILWVYVGEEVASQAFSAAGNRLDTVQAYFPDVSKARRTELRQKIKRRVDENGEVLQVRVGRRDLNVWKRTNNAWHPIGLEDFLPLPPLQLTEAGRNRHLQRDARALQQPEVVVLEDHTSPRPRGAEEEQRVATLPALMDVALVARPSPAFVATNPPEISPAFVATTSTPRTDSNTLILTPAALQVTPEERETGVEEGGAVYRAPAGQGGEKRKEPSITPPTRPPAQKSRPGSNDEPNLDESLGLAEEELELMENSAMSQYLDAPGSRETSSHQDYEDEDVDDPLGAMGNVDGHTVQEEEKETVVITAATFAHGSDIREYSVAEMEASRRRSEAKRLQEEKRWAKGGRRGSKGH